MRRAYLRQNHQRPASFSQACAVPLDPAVRALLDVHPCVPSSRTWTPNAEVQDFLDEDDQDEAQAAYLDEYNGLAEQVWKHGQKE